MAHNQQRFLFAALAFSVSQAPRQRPHSSASAPLSHTAPPPPHRSASAPPPQRHNVFRFGPLFGTFRPNSTATHNAETPTVVAVPSFTMETLLQADFSKSEAASKFYKSAFGAVEISKSYRSPWPDSSRSNDYRSITTIKLKFGGSTIVVDDFIPLPGIPETPIQCEDRRLVTETEDDIAALTRKALGAGAKAVAVMMSLSGGSVTVIKTLRVCMVDYLNSVFSTEFNA